MRLTPRAVSGRPSSFGLMKFVSFGTLGFILLSSFFLALFLANYARKVLLDKEHDFAQFLATTLNNNITRRFTVPVLLGFGEIKLSNKDQYDLLDRVIRDVLQDLPVQDVRIYDLAGTIGYATEKDLVNRGSMGGEAVTLAAKQEQRSFEFIYQTSYLGAMFSPEIAPHSVVMRTVVPMRIQYTFRGGRFVPQAASPSDRQTPEAIPQKNRKNALPEDNDAATSPGAGKPPLDKQAAPGTQAETPPGQSGARQDAPQATPDSHQTTPEGQQATSEGQQDNEETGDVKIDQVAGVLEFTWDITADYRKLITFQRIIILSSLATALIIFLVLRMLIHRADRLSAQRQREKEEFEHERVQNEKLVSMGRMVAGIAHEIRNPLGIIRSSAELLASRQRDKDPLTAKILSAIHEEAVRLSKTVGDFLDYARPKAFKLEPLDLSMLLDQVLTFLEQKCREQNVEVVRDYPPLVTVRGDKDLLYRALYNITVNALEAMAEDARHAQDDGHGQIVVSISDQDDGTLLTIMDTGPGIPADIRDKLLDPFFTTKSAGTGLGLAITANILRGHEAALALGDNPEGGARVDILFPRN